MCLDQGHVTRKKACQSFLKAISKGLCASKMYTVDIDVLRFSLSITSLQRKKDQDQDQDQVATPEQQKG